MAVSGAAGLPQGPDPALAGGGGFCGAWAWRRRDPCELRHQGDVTPPQPRLHGTAGGGTSIARRAV